MTVALVIASLGLAAWTYLMVARGGFWLMRERDSADPPPAPASWPSVTAIVPARDEAESIAQSMGSLLSQDYCGRFRIVLVDDQSTDETAAIARGLDTKEKLTVVAGASLPPGWTGKLWALKQGIAQAESDSADYLWLTDADIVHTPDNLSTLVARAESEKLVLVSLMAKLNCQSFAERALIPAFVFFFAMLYPFSWTNRKSDSTAAAAGGCMLLKREALEQAGGIESIRREIIDDCALAKRMKKIGPIWLGLTERAVSLRRYPRISDIGEMVSRSAYAQLGYSPMLLAGTIIGMLVVYLAPAVITLTPTGAVGLWAGMIAATSWLIMATIIQPILTFYHRSTFWALALPFIGAAYALFTLQSAIQYWRGRGGMWKGRAQAVAEL